MTDTRQQHRAEIERLEALIEKLRIENRVLREKAQQADSANKAKSDFLAMISHEIRTPMNGVIGIGELLLGTELESRQKHFAELILISARNLLTLINSLLDFSKIEADKMELESEEFDLKVLLGEIMSLYSVSGQQHGLDVRADIDSTLADTYFGDAHRLRQILVNLLGNAIKFTEHGGVSLKLRRESRDEKGELLRFEIIDSGPGIPVDKLDQLFIAFSQLDSSSTRRYSGTGLGLSICRKLVELMGGDIGVDSTPGRGSTFWFTLILPLTDKPDQETGLNDLSGETLQQEQKRVPDRPWQLGSVPDILIVDDDSTNRTVMKEVFRKTRALISTAVHGREAVSCCEEKAFDLIFMDCRMPVMDGFEATSAVRRCEQADNRKPSVIIALTADATTATQKRCRDVGMDDYLIKPLDFDKLQQMLDTWLPGFALHILSHHALETMSPVQEQEGGRQVINEFTLGKLKQNVGNIDNVIKVFLNIIPARLNELEQSVKTKDLKSIQSVAHTLKGSSSQFGAEELARLCEQAEHMGRFGKQEQIESLLQKIRSASDRVVKFLTEQLD